MYMFSVCGYGHVNVGAYECHKKVSGTLKLEFQVFVVCGCPMWVLGSKLESSTIKNMLNHLSKPSTIS